MKLKDIVKAYRTKNDLTQREFAAKCQDVSHAYIAIIENDINPNTGKPPRPSIEKLESIAHGMGMTFEELRDMIEDRPRKFQYAPEPRHLSPEILNMIPNAMPYTPGVAVPIVGTVRCGPGGGVEPVRLFLPPRRG